MTAAARMRAGADGERGVAVVAALVVTSALAAIGLGLAVVGSTETELGGHFRSSRETFYAADAALAEAIAALGTAVDWNPFLSGAAPPVAWDDGSPAVPTDVAAMTTGVQATSDATLPAVPDRPVWRAIGWGDLAGLTGDASVTSPIALAAWIGDDLADGDGSPATDSNGVVSVRAQALGPSGARTTLEAILARVTTATESGSSEVVRILSWREIP